MRDRTDIFINAQVDYIPKIAVWTPTYGIAIGTFVMVGSQRACESQRRGVDLQRDTRL